jgi:hypothetical protein
MTAAMPVAGLKQAQLFALRRRTRRHALPPLEYQLSAAGLPAPDPEFTFAWHALGRRWAFDYAWPPWKIALEIEGGVFIQGRHTTGVGFTRDCEKYNRAAILGWLVIRATPDMVRAGQAIDTLRDAFAARGLE